MWLLVGMTILVSNAVLAKINDERAYITETDENRSLEGLENNGETGLEVPEVKRLKNNENEQQQRLQWDNESSLDYSTLKSDARRSIVQSNLQDKTSEYRQTPAPLATLLYWPDQQDQAIGMKSHRNPLIQGPPSFSPWGGKRDLQRYKLITKIRRPPRVPFNSWGGKRSYKRTRYALGDINGVKFLNSEGRKTPPFNSWGGKRALMKFHPHYDASAKNRYGIDEKYRGTSRRRIIIGNDDVTSRISEDDSQRPNDNFR